MCIQKKNIVETHKSTPDIKNIMRSMVMLNSVLGVIVKKIKMEIKAKKFK
jgi:hypothetical protein